MLESKKVKFSEDIRKLCDEKSLSYLDAVLHWCELNNLDEEYAADLIMKDQQILSRIQSEAEDLNFLKKTSRLPI
jgi:hypothetical protein